MRPLALALVVIALPLVACSKPENTAPRSAPVGSAAPTAALAPPSPLPKLVATPPAPPPAASVVASKAKLPKCPAGTTLAWADNDRAKCLRPCDGTDDACAKGETCVPANEVDDDGDPIPHDIVDVCLAAPVPEASTGTPAPKPRH